MKKRLFPAVFIILFMIVFAIMAVIYAPTAISKTESPTFKNIMFGTWAPIFEKELNESFPIFEGIRGFWGRFEYDVFGEGRKGVLIGKNGWLFTDEEFSCVTNGAENMSQNLSYISEISQSMKNKNIELFVVLIPSKARVYEEYLGKYVVPACRKNLYRDVTNYLEQKSISVISVFDVFANSENKNALFLKTDTHWTPQGARLAALHTASKIDTSRFDRKEFSSIEGEMKKHEGDLLRYLPGVENSVITQDTLSVYETQAVSSDNEEDAALALFSTSIVPVTLVGTSYSANSTWNFHGFLKSAMNVDVLNMADEGLGPFAVMDTYLSSDTWQNNPPSLVVWEIPERYITIFFKKTSEINH